MKMLLDIYRDERGLETVEYAMILGLIVVGVLAVVGSIGQWVTNIFTQTDQGLAAS